MPRAGYNDCMAYVDGTLITGLTHDTDNRANRENNSVQGKIRESEFVWNGMEKSGDLKKMPHT